MATQAVRSGNHTGWPLHFTNFFQDFVSCYGIDWDTLHSLFVLDLGHSTEASGPSSSQKVPE